MASTAEGGNLKKKSLLKQTSDVLCLQESGAVEWATTASLALLYDIKSQQRLMSAELLAAAQALFLAALRLLRNGLNADPLLKALGIRWRLSDAVLMNTALGRDDENCESAFALEGVIPGELLRTLQRGFADGKHYWSEHKYSDPDTPFFSYLASDLTGKPSSAIEQTAQLILRQLQRRERQSSSKIRAAEIWAHCRDPRSPHQMHFDTDETKLGSGGVMSDRLSHPVSQSPTSCHPSKDKVLTGRPQEPVDQVWSTVVFLHCCCCAGPTVVVDQTAAQDLGCQAWVAQPKGGSVLCYQGNLLHGVLPGTCFVCSQHCKRITLVIAFWGEALQSRASVAPQPGMPLPSWQPGCGGWISDFPCTEIEIPVDGCTERALSRHQPAWVEVEEEVSGSEHLQLRTTDLPDLRFFLRNADDIRRLYAPRGVF